MCKHCGVNYPKTEEYYYRADKNGRLRAWCKDYQNRYMREYHALFRKNKRFVTVELDKPLPKRMEQLPEKDSEYHKAMESTAPLNNDYFLRLCAGVI